MDALESLARVAEPVLAGCLIDGGELRDVVEEMLGDGREWSEDRVGTGVKSLDGALGGGLRRGCVVAVSGEVGMGGSEVRGSISFRSLFFCVAALLGYLHML